MAHIVAKDVTVDFPVYASNTRSLKKLLVNATTGGRFARDAADRVVVRALDSVSFEFREGDRVGVIGHNGSGKSTLLRVLAGIHEPVSGQLIVDGTVTSMLSIFLGMDMEATGLENIYMRGHVMGIAPATMRTMFDEIVDFTGLGDFLHLPMRTYSTGMAMRLAFAVATSVEADIVLMDEWLSVGDVEFVKKAQLRLDQFVSKASIVVLASHNLGLVKEQCNKILNLEHGVLTEQTPE
jgi:lipopolysaccharide transport system ATP-binding protein